MNNRYFEDVCFVGCNNDCASKANQPYKGHVASIFRVEEETDQDTGCDMFLRNVG
jgi:hypothetical protein